MAETPGDPVELYRARGLPEAHALRNALEAEGITARIDNELLQGVVGELPLGWATAPRILIARTDEPAARLILEHALRQTSMAGAGDGAGLHCLACRTVMGDADVCPICGWSYRGEPGEPAVTPPLGESRPSEVTDATPEESVDASVQLPERTIRSLWMEVAAVLAVGVVPNAMGAVSHLCHSTPPSPYWLDSLNLSVLSVCTTFVTLYLIGRSGEPWKQFGVTRPRLWDLPLGLLLFAAAGQFWLAIPSFLWPDAASSHDAFAVADGTAYRVTTVVKYGLSALAEEVVTRAYLITRLAMLLRSRGEAVLVAAIVFASYHAYQGAFGTAHAFVFGIVYGVAFLATGRLWPLVIGHALYNVRLEWLAG